MIDHKSALKRICKFCTIIKPERAHHCRVCRKCVLKYDHHCRFLSNCIGVLNYKYFFLLLLYSVVLLVFILITMLDGFYILNEAFGWETAICKVYALTYIFIFVIFVAVFDLFVFHAILLWRGKTTVENKDRTTHDSQNSCKTNMKQSLGGGCCLLCPTSN